MGLRSGLNSKKRLTGNGAASYTLRLKMKALMATRYFYCSFTYRYPYGVAATVKRMRAGVEWM